MMYTIFKIGFNSQYGPYAHSSKVMAVAVHVLLFHSSASRNIAYLTIFSDIEIKLILLYQKLIFNSNVRCFIKKYLAYI